MGADCLGFEGLFLPHHGVRVAFCHDRYVLYVWSFGCVVQGAWFVEGHESDERSCDLVGARLGGPWGVPGAAWQ